MLAPLLNGERKNKMSNTVPYWFKKTSVYQINPRTFTADGTIKAITGELPMLAELGFGIIYLCPIFKEDASEDKAYWSDRQRKYQTENPKNPYRMDDYFEIDSEYGCMDDLRELVVKAHALGLKVVLDLVYLHIGPNATMFKAHPEFAAKNEDGSEKLTIWRFPYLNYKSEGLREYLWCNMCYYIGVIDVDGFRCDVGDEVPLDFWREGKRRIRAIKPDAVMINEGSKPEAFTVFDANYGFTWHENLFSFLKGSLKAKDVIERYEHFRSVYPEGALILRDMENHDTVTDWPYRVEKQLGHDCMEAITALNYTIDGVPMVYCGNELADTARLNMFANRFHMGVYETTDRTKVTEASEKRKSVIKKLNTLRAENEIIQDGKTVWLDSESDSVLAFERELDGKKVTYIGNFSGAEIETNFSVIGETLLSNGAGTRNGKLTLSGYGYVIFTEV